MATVAVSEATGLHQAPPQAEPKPALKPCCACPETKQARDAWEAVSFLDQFLVSVKNWIQSPSSSSLLLNEGDLLLDGYFENFLCMEDMKHVLYKKMSATR